VIAVLDRGFAKRTIELIDEAKSDAGVKLLAKKRVYELAKELNTTSKRLMEKLEEINIVVKNHMSF